MVGSLHLAQRPRHRTRRPGLRPSTLSVAVAVCLSTCLSVSPCLCLYFCVCLCLSLSLFLSFSLFQGFFLLFSLFNFDFDFDFDFLIFWFFFFLNLGPLCPAVRQPKVSPTDYTTLYTDDQPHTVLWAHCSILQRETVLGRLAPAHQTAPTCGQKCVCV